MTRSATPAAPAVAGPAGPPAAQQPDWAGHPGLGRAVRRLASAPPLVGPDEIARARRALGEVAEGRAVVLQAGDCAERLDECGAGHTARRLAELDALAALLSDRTGHPVLRIGRMAGQYAKPRSSPVEEHDGVVLPVYRGDLVNAPEPDERARRPDPDRLVRAHRAAATVLAGVRAHPSQSGTGPFTSHEALVLDYERPQVRHDPVSGDDHLTSTHLPWIGDRTADPGQAHVALLARVANPVACKVGPTATPDRLRRLCALLDPDRSPGRLTLVSRMGRDRVRTLLAPLVAAVRDAGHPVVWLCDPMHGNTVRTPDGTKTRMLADVVAEVRAFGEVLAAAGVHAGGLHLETAATPVTECVGADVPGPGGLVGRYESPCDPRLNPVQARAVIAAC